MPDRAAYMIVRRDRLRRLMELTGESSRAVAKAAGWRSHSYVLRLLSGQARTVSPSSAVRLATHFRVEIGDLFVPRVHSATERNPHRDHHVPAA